MRRRLIIIISAFENRRMTKWIDTFLPVDGRRWEACQKWRSPKNQVQWRFYHATTVAAFVLCVVVIWKFQVFWREKKVFQFKNFTQSQCKAAIFFHFDSMRSQILHRNACNDLMMNVSLIWKHLPWKCKCLWENGTTHKETYKKKRRRFPVEQSFCDNANVFNDCLQRLKYLLWPEFEMGIEKQGQIVSFSEHRTMHRHTHKQVNEITAKQCHAANEKTTEFHRAANKKRP